MSSKKEISSGAEKAENLSSATKKNDNSDSSAKSKNNGGASNLKASDTINANEKAVGARNINKNKQTAGAQKSGSAKAKISAENNGKKVEKSAINKPTKKATIKANGAKLSAQDEKKLKLAQIKEERKQKRLAKRLAYKEKLKAEDAKIKEMRAERKARAQEKKAKNKKMSVAERINALKQERAAKIEARNAKRQEKLANMRAAREHKLKAQAEKRAEKREQRRAPGFGGWLAAVISLGAATLALGTILTFGWINASGMRANMAGAQTQSIYELNSIVDNLDRNLSKARVATSTSDRTKLLSDIAIESEMAEVILERMCLDCTVTDKATAFINNMGENAKQMLYKIARGEKLSESDINSIEYMYKTNLQFKNALNEMTSKMTKKDVLSMLDGKKDCLMLKTFSDLQNKAFDEPKDIADGPFSKSNKELSAKYLQGLESITAPDAENKCKKYFSDYKIKDAKCTGEATTKGLELYNVTLTLEDDSEMLAQVSKKGGLVILFDSYKECADKKFSIDRCKNIAEDFLKTLGYSEVKAVWSSENGTTCNLTFAYEKNGVVFYTDMIKVKVCEERGIVTGLEALPFVLNHTERNADKPTVNIADAKKALSANFNIESERLAVIKHNNNERLTWEFAGNAGEREYYVYVDANTGEELEILTVTDTKQGKILK
ncbi:MAG: hypothetical protein E7370_03960 [Clostridiales bacterium]|nr:hypothetical protein [Clostridiales bacterium]